MKSNSVDERADDESRRSFIKKTAYVAPMILTLSAVPAFASEGSGRGDIVNETPTYEPPGNGGTSVHHGMGNSSGLSNRRRRSWFTRALDD
jgi:hypothetical protein